MVSICCVLNFFCFIIICLILPGLHTYQPKDRLQGLFFMRVVRFELILLLIHGTSLLFRVADIHGWQWAQSREVLVLSFLLGVIGDVFFFTIAYFYIRFLQRYLVGYIGERNWMRTVRFITAMITILGIVILFLLRLQAHIERTIPLFPGSLAYWISHICGYSLTVMCVWILASYLKQIGIMDLVVLSSFFVLPTIVSVARLIIPNIHLLAVGGAVSIIGIFINIHLKQNRALQKNELELSRTQVKLMNSEIQPHFIYNALNSIYILCGKDVSQAQEAIVMFSEYLRGKMQGMMQNEAVPFERELDLVRNYLMLEKMRYQDELQVEYDIQVKDFMVPPLSVQPLVENAIRHGLSPKQDGGKIIIRALEEADHYEISVIDDGVGPSAELDDHESDLHIGKKNVGERIALICGGTLQITGENGKGTTATIRIPKERDPEDAK